MSISKAVVLFLGFGMVMVSALPAQAGGGAGGGGTDFLAFQCYLVTGGARQKRVVNLVDQFGETQNVHINGARLLCTPTIGTLVEGELEIVDGLPDHLKCYGAVPLSNSRVEVQTSDPFGTETLETRKAGFLCVPAVKTLLP